MAVSLRHSFVLVVLISVAPFALCAFSRAQNASAPNGNAAGHDNNGQMNASETKQNGNSATSTGQTGGINNSGMIIINPPSQAGSQVLPVIAIDCHPAILPNAIPPTGLNYLDFRYPSSAIGVAGGGQPGTPTAWQSNRIMMPMYCEFTIHQNIELYDVFFNLHVSFYQAAKRHPGQVETGAFVVERDWPIAIGRINNNFSFGFYAFTTSDYMVNVAFPDTAKYFGGQSNDPKEARLLTINWKSLSLAPASAFTPNN